MGGDTPPNDKPSFPDTPAWAPSRTNTVKQVLYFGMVTVCLGAAGSIWHMAEPIATLLINSGETLLLAASGLHVGAASAERIGAWFSPQEPQSGCHQELQDADHHHPPCNQPEEHCEH